MKSTKRTGIRKQMLCAALALTLLLLSACSGKTPAATGSSAQTAPATTEAPKAEAPAAPAEAPKAEAPAEAPKAE